MSTTPTPHPPLDGWRALAARDEAVAGGIGLHLPAAAVLLANAVWYPDPERLVEVPPWCERHAIPDAIVVDGADARRRSAAERAGYRRSAAFEAVPVEPDGADGAHPSDAHGPLVEQVAFGASHHAGLLLARRYRQPENAVPIGSAIADALRRRGALLLWLAYRGDAAVGALLAHRGAGPDAPWSGLLEAGDDAALRALAARLAAAAAAEGRPAVRWRARGGHGSLPTQGVLRLERARR